VLVNVRLAEMRDPFADSVLTEAFAQAEATLAERGRLLIRKSGTEPMIRVMVEGENEEQVTKLANDLADLVRTRLSA
jgi:phosphoglucosamine mutase